jgi:adenylate cyclase
MRAAADFAFLPVGAMALKGKSAPLPLFALVGGRETRDDPAFAILVERHTAAMAALAAGDAATAAAALAAARALGIDGFAARAARLAAEITAQADDGAAAAEI